MAVKKKSAAKKVAKKAPAKKVAKKVAKKAPAKKAAIKRVVKKTTVKKTAVKKTAVKKTAVKKAAVKKAVVKKRVAKKAAARRAVKKPSVRVTAPVVVVATTPIAPVVTKPVLQAPKPVAAPKQATSGRVAFLVVAGIVILAAIVWSKSGSKTQDGASPTPSISQSTEPTSTPTAEPTKSAVAVAVVEAPSKFVALKSADGLKLRWLTPMATEGLTGYNVELRANGAGDWITVATVPADQLTQNVTKSGDVGWTQFRVTSVYSDGQVASSAVFGIPGEFK